jgi:hypothetical protein
MRQITKWYVVMRNVDACVRSSGEGLALVLHGTLSIVSMLEDYVDLTEEQKRATAIDLVGQFYKDVVEPLQLGPGLLDGYIDSTIEGLIPTFVGSVYDAVSAFVKKVI